MVVLVIICVGLIILGFLTTPSIKVDPPVISASTKLKNDLKTSTNATNSTVNSITKKIEERKPVATVVTSKAPSDLKVKNLAVEKTKDKLTEVTAVVKDESQQHVTNVYAVDASKKNKHGLGVYAGSSNNNHDFCYGISYRNRRVIYTAGSSSKHNFDFRVTYEVAQW